MTKHYPPIFKQLQFHCPFCQVFAAQSWNQTYTPGGHTVKSMEVCKCSHCQQYSVWINEKMVYPDANVAPPCHEDLPTNIVADYQEAASILSKSPRGSAALLRLALQKLMQEIGEEGKDINKDIGSLVKKGLPEEVQKALDILRVIGNESVHPGTLDMKDDTETAVQLFELINYIVEDRITLKKKIGQLYSRLPQNKLQGIAQRDQ